MARFRETITAHDVAALAGVSQSAVSRTFTPGASVSQKMAEKVREAATALGYRPNTLARSLITGRSRTIGLIVAYFDNPFYTEALENLSLALKERGYGIMIFMAANQAEEVDPLVEDLLDKQVDGIIIASVGMSNTLTDRLTEAGFPLVLFNRGQNDVRLSSVTSANYDGGRKVAEFLIAGGHERIAHISGWQGSSTGRDRFNGFAAGMQAAGRKIVAQVDGMYRRPTAIEAARQVFAGPVRPDAVFVGNDHMAFAVMDTLRREMRLRVPEDVSVVGYDDVAMAAWPAYDLTTVRQPANRMVARTVDKLIAMIEEGDVRPQKIEIDGPLKVRGSARLPTGWSDEGV